MTEHGWDEVLAGNPGSHPQTWVLGGTASDMLNRKTNVTLFLYHLK